MALNRWNIFLVAVLLAAELVSNAEAATYVVGDSLGWTVPPTAATYAIWASQHVFVVGDVLVFNFPTGIHDVAKVTSDSCSSNNPIALATLGPANFTLNSTGEDHYICTFGQHCSLGQRLSINVTSAAAAPSPPMTPAPTPTMTPAPPTPTMTPAPTPTMTPAPPTPTMTPAPTPAMTPAPPTPTMTLAPTPAMTPSPYVGAPVPSPVLTPSPESVPSPTPGGGGSVISPSPSFGGVSPPGLAPGPTSSSTGDNSPPPPPGSGSMRTKLVAPLVVFASIAIGLVL